MKLPLAETIVFFSLLVPSWAGATTIAPAVAGRIDDSPRDGVPDSTLVGTVDPALFPSIDRRGIFEFDISSQSGPYTLARLDLFAFGGSNTFDVYGYVGDGSLTLPDWSAGALVGSATVGSLGVTYSIDVLSFMNSLPGGTNLVGFNIRMRNESTTVGLAVDKSFLELGAVPEPSTLLLLGSALIGASGYRRRRAGPRANTAARRAAASNAERFGVTR